MKKILLITSSLTGTGHKSISDALAEQFTAMPGVEAQTMEGFELTGRLSIWLTGVYGFLTRRFPAVYNAIWKFTDRHPSRFGWADFLYGRRIVKILRRIQPDLILTVHSMFNIGLTRILKRRSLEFPVAVLQADLVNIHSTWCNPEASVTICPTREAYDESLCRGIPPEKLKVLGLPVRKRFCDAAREADAKGNMLSRPLRCLLMGGGEGCGDLKAYAEAILMHTDSMVTIVCSYNRKLFRNLQKRLGGRFGSRVNVLGFVDEIDQLMLHSDLLVSRASPNTLYEAIMLKLPVVMIGPLPAQEKDNPRLIQENGLGVFCASPEDAPQIIRELLEDDGARFRKIRAAQEKFRRFDDARNVAVFVAEQIKPAANQ
jgi:processive 1,2-diacylglycerol beta-glucosyltransferase